MGRIEREPKHTARDQSCTQADGRKPVVRLGYYRPVPVGAWPFESIEIGTREFPAGAEPSCAACGTVNFRRDRNDDKPETMPFEVLGPDGTLRLECGGCRPEFVDLAALRKQRAAPADHGVGGPGAGS